MEVELIIVPYDSGYRDVRMGAGPRHLIAGGLEPALAQIGHAVVATTIVEPRKASRGEIAIAFALMADLANAVRTARGARRFPLVLAGNCNTAIGTIAGLGGGTGTAVLWFDAHGDFNTPETTTSGFLDGMALATLTGRCWHELACGVPGFSPVPESGICLAGARDVDPLESETLARSKIVTVAASDVPSALGRVLASLSSASERAYVHVDLDVLDPREGRANQFAVPDGVTLDGLLQGIAAAGRALPIEGAALTAYDPGIDTRGEARTAALRIAQALVEAGTRSAASHQGARNP